ncbi:hypothetical protein MVEN_02010800 [Mycena venus]|uniref:Uncharacterized protein n=1 Tax=Mycena venus TaxID=2733690 RepID=A0A8H6XAX0_9AGAR|nr:hypothetical protein MVEN_02010800 [Mycena venus]
MLAAAANASSHASTSALTTTAKAAVESAPSPFAQLLRSSRFATYDPLIRKTYYSPKQFVERGYWGLKRPITQRKKNSFITIKQWETRQHFAEWDNAEDQVRFLRRMEELNVRPGASDGAKWIKQLGAAKGLWLVDSEFSPHAWPVVMQNAKEGEEAEAEASEAAESSQSDVLEPSPEIHLNELGNKGPGGREKVQYRRPPDSVIPNVASMSPVTFERYLKKLRSLRPAFKKYLDREEERQKADQMLRDAMRAKNPNKSVGKSLEPKIGGRTLLQVAQIPDGPFHRLFLAQHTESEYQSTNRIQPQPHRNGALMYSHPSQVDTLFRNKPKPGIVLDKYHAGRYQTEKPQYTTAFAGIAAVLDMRDAPNHIPLMDPGVDVERWPWAVAEMRPITKSPLKLVDVPRVVGRDPEEGLSGVRVDLQVTVKRAFDDPRRTNPHVPGSREYVALDALDAPALERCAERGDVPSTLCASPRHLPQE